MSISDQSTGKCYQMQISEYAVAGINDRENATQCNLLSIQLHKTMTSKCYQMKITVYADTLNIDRETLSEANCGLCSCGNILNRDFYLVQIIKYKL